MPGELHRDTMFLSIIQGKFSQKVDATTPGAKRRDYELKSGVKGTKYELIYDTWSGVLRELNFKDTKYGTFMNLEFDDATVSVNTESRYFTDTVSKLASVQDFTLPITLAPYDFITEKDEKRTGMNILQGETKHSNFFYSKEEKKNINDFPVPEGDTKTYEKTDWIIYFARVQKFLKAYALMTIATKLTGELPEEPLSNTVEEIQINPDDIPF